MHDQHIHITHTDGICIIRLNRPEIRNALVMEMREELLHAFQKLEVNEEVKCIVLTGEGKAFSSGGDLSALQELAPLEGRKRLQRGHELLMKMLELEKPIIAAVNGAAAGAGFSLALICDMIIASEQAFFVQSFASVGLIPDLGALHFLPQLVGPHKAKELMFTGERIMADEAERLGIVNKLVPHDELLQEAVSLAQKVSAKSPISVKLTKKIMNQHLHNNLKLLLELESSVQDLCFQTEDFREGVAAFFEKRQPVFKGK
jgi:2-(1,2-epoxy-1,2-dihydrophenyl)acetyl-CoA isomerase